LEIILKALPPENIEDDSPATMGSSYMPQNDFVAKYGLDHYDLSMRALYQMTKRFSAMALSAFILKYPNEHWRYSQIGQRTKSHVGGWFRRNTSAFAMDNAVETVHSGSAVPCW
jgi:hypothetical protein